MRAWLQLFRVPNLFTVPGDPIAGFLLAAGALDRRAFAAVGASLCLYAAGLAMNDLLDFDEDRRDRPNRPLTSGAIALPAAWGATVVLILIGLGALYAAAGGPGLATGGALVAAVTLYNGWAKRIAVVGSLVMGSCRGLSVLVGAVAAQGKLDGLPVALWLGAWMMVLYIAAVTNLARHETKPSAPVSARMLPIVPPVVAFAVASWEAAWFSAAAFAMAVFFTGAELRRLLAEKPAPIPPVIGALIRVMLLLQAGLCLAHPESQSAWIAAAALIALMPVACRVGRWFYAS